MIISDLENLLENISKSEQATITGGGGYCKTVCVINDRGVQECRLECGVTWLPKPGTGITNPGIGNPGTGIVNPGIGHPGTGITNPGIGNPALRPVPSFTL